MPLPTTAKIVQFYTEFQTTFAVIFGMCLQFLAGEKRTWRIATLVIASALYVALYIMPIIIELLNMIPKVSIVPGSDVERGMYAVSALLSMEILAFTISVLPKAARCKVTKFLGVPDDKSCK